MSATDLKLILFDGASRAILADHLSSASLTALVEHDGDINIVLGVATHQSQAEKKIRRGSGGVLFDRFRRAAGIKKKRRSQ